jgi:hypothetical protein
LSPDLKVQASRFVAKGASSLGEESSVASEERVSIEASLPCVSERASPAEESTGIVDES